MKAYDVVVLSDIGANTLLLPDRTFVRSERTPNRLELLANFVREGGGLLMVGGYLTFQGIQAKGNYKGTPVEDVLPVMLEAGDDLHITRLRAMDDEVNQRHSDIKLFVAELNRSILTEDEARRGLELAGRANDFEAIGDIIAKTLLSQATDKARLKVRFSDEGWRELSSLHARVMANTQIALNVLVSGDLESARLLVAEKAVLRQVERDFHDRHIARLRSGNLRSIDTSDIHMEVVRALKEVNSLLVKVAYPILSESGQLLESRLAEPA